MEDSTNYNEERGDGSRTWVEDGSSQPEIGQDNNNQRRRRNRQRNKRRSENNEYNRQEDESQSSSVLLSGEHGSGENSFTAPSAKEEVPRPQSPSSPPPPPPPPPPSVTNSASVSVADPPSPVASPVEDEGKAFLSDQAMKPILLKQGSTVIEERKGAANAVGSPPASLEIKEEEEKVRGVAEGEASSAAAPPLPIPVLKSSPTGKSTAKQQNRHIRFEDHPVEPQVEKASVQQQGWGGASPLPNVGVAGSEAGAGEQRGSAGSNGEGTNTMNTTSNKSNNNMTKGSDANSRNNKKDNRGLQRRGGEDSSFLLQLLGIVLLLAISFLYRFIKGRK